MSAPAQAMFLRQMREAAAGRPVQAELLAGTLATRLEADPQAFGRLVLAEIALARKDPRKAVDYRGLHGTRSRAQAPR